MSDKTEEASPRRLRKAREEGDSGASAYAAQALAFVVAVALVPSAVRALATWAADGLRAAIAQAAAPGAARFDAASLCTTVEALAVPVLLAAGLAGGVAHLVQTGGVVATSRLTPKLGRLDPLAGLRNLVSGARLFAVARALVAGVFVRVARGARGLARPSRRPFAPRGSSLGWAGVVVGGGRRAASPGGRPWSAWRSGVARPRRDACAARGAAGFG